jgi:Ca2+-transporting ATPase
MHNNAEYCHQTTIEVVLKFDSNEVDGLTQQEAKRRFLVEGPNELPVSREESWHEKLLDQFNNPMIYLLLASASISYIIGEINNTISITVVCNLKPSFHVSSRVFYADRNSKL